MTEKIKAKNADAICALVNNKVIQYLSCMGSWEDCQLTKFGDQVIVLTGMYTHHTIGLAFFLKDKELRVKHLHQDLIDQIEADLSLEQYLESQNQLKTANLSWNRTTLHNLINCAKSGKFRINKPHPHQNLIDQIEADPSLKVEVWDAYWNTDIDHGYKWRDSTIKEVKSNTEDGFKFRIKENSAHPHQTLIDLHKANPDLIVQFFSPSSFIWLCVDDPSWEFDMQYRIIIPEVIATSEGVK